MKKKLPVVNSGEKEGIFIGKTLEKFLGLKGKLNYQVLRTGIRKETKTPAAERSPSYTVLIVHYLGWLSLCGVLVNITQLKRI